jgi:hypothetical protein
MALPDLRHFRDGGIYSDPVEALVGEAWVPAIYTDKGWATADGANLSTDHHRMAHTMPKYTGPGKPQKPAPKKKGGKK